MNILLNSSLLFLVVAALTTGGMAFFTYHTAKRVQVALPPAGGFVEVPGATLHVRDQGKGPAILLIHGLAGQMGHYAYGVADQLAGQFRVITVDRPGSGYSVRHDSTAADLSTQAAALAALIRKLQLGRTMVVGHSLGGAVALTLALEHPDLVAGLALLAPLTHLPDGNGVPGAFSALTISSPPLRNLFAWTVATPGSIARREAILEQVFGPDEVPHDFGTRGGGLLGLRPSHFVAASADLQALPEHLPAISSRYAELRAPLSVLFARGDRILNWKKNGRALVDKVPGATLELVDGGHMLPVTHPQLTVRFIRNAAERVFATALSG
jgi:pimeloyl-ACP methyl ester carboxylesterase